MNKEPKFSKKERKGINVRNKERSPKEKSKLEKHEREITLNKYIKKEATNRVAHNQI